MDDEPQSLLDLDELGQPQYKKYEDVFQIPDTCNKVAIIRYTKNYGLSSSWWLHCAFYREDGTFEENQFRYSTALGKAVVTKLDGWHRIRIDDNSWVYDRAIG